MTQTVAVLGAGAMGTACSILAARDDDTQVRLWGRNATFVRHMRETRENMRLLPGIRIPRAVDISDDAAAVLQDADVVFVSVPTRSLREAVADLKPLLPADSLLVSVMKGIENGTLMLPSEILRSVLGDCRVAALGGPCHAEEAVAGMPASVVVASNDEEAAGRIQTLLSRDTFRVYRNSDLRGVELGGALKNVVAIAAGICDGLELGDNARSALMTRGLSEIVRYGVACGAREKTFYGLAGIGDLITTCGSQHSRNRRVGEWIGRGLTPSEAEQKMAAVAEGVRTAQSVVDQAGQLGIEMPIAEEVCQVLFSGKTPQDALRDLMNRPLKEE